MNLLEVQNLHVRFATYEGEVHAVRGVDFTLAPGQTLGIVGESGSGKSQTVLALMGLLPDNAAVSGRVRFEDQELLGLPTAALNRIRGARIGMVFQDPMTSLNPYLSIGRQLTEVLQLHRGMDRRSAQAEAIRMLDAVRIPEAPARLRQYPHELSGGMRQRVMIAMALLCRPALLIADEPTTALDVTVQAQILALLRELRHEFGTAIVLITHDLGMVAALCDQVLVMYAGEAVEGAALGEIFASPQHPYTLSLLAAMPRLEIEPGAHLVTVPGNPPNLAALPSGCPFHPRCPYRFEPCDRQLPELTQLGGGRFKRCHLPEAPPSLAELIS